jgi:hypothetical protein
MAIPFLSKHLSPVLLTPAQFSDVAADAPAASTPADDATTPLTLQELATVAGGWGQIDPI